MLLPFIGVSLYPVASYEPNMDHKVSLRIYKGSESFGNLGLDHKHLLKEGNVKVSADEALGLAE